MKTLLPVLALTAALTSAALAGGPVTPTGAARSGPVALTAAQLDTITAGHGGGISGGGVDVTLYGVKSGAGTEQVTASDAKLGAGVEIEA